MTGHQTTRTGYSAASLEFADPAAQILALEGRSGKPYLGVEPPAFEPQTPTEVLLLHEVLNRRGVETGTAHTFAGLWGAIPLKKDLDLDATSVRDVTSEDPRVGISWVGFDPCGVVVDNETDFRADVFVGKVSAHEMGVRAPFRGQRPIWEIAGLEVFTALVAFPGLMQEAWIDDRQYPLRPIIPRLTAIGDRGLDGAVALNWWVDSGIHCFAQGWEYNFYGHSWVVPTVRKLA